MALPKNPKFDLKLHYKRILETGLIISLLMIIGAFKFFPRIEMQRIMAESPGFILDGVDVEITRQDSRPPLPAKPIVPTIAINEEFVDIPVEDDGWNKPITDAPALPPKKEIENEPVPDYIIIADEMPSPIGGLAEIQKKIKYPYIAIKAQIEGRVTVKAFVDENGNVVRTEILKSIGGGCDEAARLAVEQTKFAPGKQRGRAVKVQVAIPVLFKLQ